MIEAASKSERLQNITPSKHYMPVVGYVKYYDDYEPKYLLKIETNGAYYYVNYDAYAEKLSWFSNILEYDFEK